MCPGKIEKFYLLMHNHTNNQMIFVLVNFTCIKRMINYQWFPKGVWSYVTIFSFWAGASLQQWPHRAYQTGSPIVIGKALSLGLLLGYNTESLVVDIIGWSDRRIPHYLHMKDPFFQLSFGKREGYITTKGLIFVPRCSNLSLFF